MKDQGWVKSLAEKPGGSSFATIPRTIRLFLEMGESMFGVPEFKKAMDEEFELVVIKLFMSETESWASAIISSAPR